MFVFKLLIMLFNLILCYQILIVSGVESLFRCPDILTPNCDDTSVYRTFDGTCNNLEHPLWGATFQCLSRYLPPDYGFDSLGHNSIRLSKNLKHLPNVRVISNILFRDRKINDSTHTHMLMQFGQLVTEDITHVVEPRRNPFHLQIDGNTFPCCEHNKSEPRFCDPIFVPKNDDFYARFNIFCINKFRTLECEKCRDKPREQRNQRSSIPDLSNLYGSTVGENHKLRTLYSGLMKTSVDVNGRCGLLMRNQQNPPQTPEDTGDSCDPKYDGICFLSGAQPVNQQPLLTTITTLFLRQHNRIANELSKINPEWRDEKVFQETRRILIAQYQAIIYGEYLPLVIGQHFLDEYNLRLSRENHFSKYDPFVNPMLFNAFSTAAFRFGHSNIQGDIMHVHANGAVTHSRLKDQYFHPLRIFNGELDSFLRGLTRQEQAAFDPHFVDDVRNHLYQPFDFNFGQDLPSLNTQRGRDHGLQGYVRFIEYCDGTIIKNFQDLSKYMDDDRWETFAQIYEHPEDIDLFPGGLSERPVPNGVVGPTFACLIAEQFKNFKFGDRYYFEHGNQAGSFTKNQLNAIRKTKLAGIICNNVDNFGPIQRKVFQLIKFDNQLQPCSQMYDLVTSDLILWKQN